MSREDIKTILQVGLLILVIYVFLVSIGLMGSSFKLFGKDLARQLMQVTSNPLVGLVAGVLATTLVQSSSTTTSIAVGMVAGGVLTIPGAIPVVMGANIGTSVTNTLVSMGHITRREEFERALAGATVHDFFNLCAVLVLLPAEIAFGYLTWLSGEAAALFHGVGGMHFGSPLKLVTKPVVEGLLGLLGESPVLGLIVSFILLYGALKFLVDLTKSLVVRRSERFLNRYLFGSPLVAMAFGMVVTSLVQSSSITTSMVVPLVGAGILTVEAVFPYTLGANVGTTVTAMLASLATGNLAAVTVAFAHLFFNLTGIGLVYPVRLVRFIPIRLAKALARLASRNRLYAVVYIVGVFYLVPLILILLAR